MEGAPLRRKLFLLLRDDCVVSQYAITAKHFVGFDLYWIHLMITTTAYPPPCSSRRPLRPSSSGSALPTIHTPLPAESRQTGALSVPWRRTAPPAPCRRRSQSRMPRPAAHRAGQP